MENPNIYSGAHALQRADAEAVIKEFVCDLLIPKGARILDVGCGCGDVTANLLLPALPTEVEEVVGIDISESMVAHARYKYTNPNLHFHQMNIEEEDDNLISQLMKNLTTQNNNEESDFKTELLRQETQRQSVDNLINDYKLEEKDVDIALENEVNKVSIGCANNRIPDKRECKKETGDGVKRSIVTDSRFHLVFSFYCLHWIQNQRRALQNIYNMLKPGGTAIIAFLAKSTIYTMYEKVSKMQRWSSYMKDVEKYISPYHRSKDPAKELANTATEAGFSILKVECRPRSFLYSKKAHLVDAIKAVNPFYSRLSPNDEDEYLADCLRVVQQFKLAEVLEEGFNVHYNLLIAHLKR